MLASELLRRLLPSGTDNVQAIASLLVVGDVTANNGGQVLVAFSTPELDLTAAVPATDIVPARVAHRFVPSRLFAIPTVTTGAISTPPITNIGNNAGNNNMVGGSNAFPGAAQFAIGAPMTVQSAPGSPQIPTNTAIRVSVPTPATGTGGFAFTCVYAVEGYFAL